MDTYEKKYKEAQKWIESIYSELSHEHQMEAEAFFPELQESKDERIRKEIIETFKILGDGKIPVDINYADIFTWLEKQGKKDKDVRCKYLDELLYADDIYQMAMNDAMVEEAKNKAIEALSKLEISKLLGLEKKGEQKPVFEMKIPEESLGVDSDTHNKIVDECIYGDDDKKPAWSEEDEQYLLVCKNALCKYQVSDKWDADIISKWLEDKLKQGEQEPSWSEEDEEYLRRAINAAKDAYPMTANWLKSLKQRIGWKPSDEQIVVLELASKYERVFTPKQIDILIDLKEQLKKLRKE